MTDPDRIPASLGANLVELQAVLARTNLDRFLSETARFYACRLFVLGPSGEIVSSLHAEGAPGPLPPAGSPRRRPVEVYGSVLGHVLAVPEFPEDERSAIALAGHVADLLAELAMKEYELNDLSREILDSYEEVNLFYDLAAALGSVRDVEGICSVVLSKACEIIRASRASILLFDEKTSDLYVAAARGIPAEELPTIRIVPGEGITGKVFESRTARLVDDVTCLPAGLLSGYEAYATRSFISVPLCIERGGPGVGRPSGSSFAERTWMAGDRCRAIGVVNLADRLDRENFTSGDLKLLTALAGQAAVLIDNMRLIGLENELRIAHNIQRSLLPLKPPESPGYGFAGRCVPARNVGGDYYDFLVREEDGGIAAVIADVSGHNVASAIMMAVARTALRSEIVRSGDPARVLVALNDFLYEDLTRAELFLSVFLMVLDPETGRLRYSNAGHNPPLLFRRDGRGCRTIEAEGLLAGVLDDVEYHEESMQLEPGDLILLYTDGLVEAQDGHGALFGMDRLAGILEKHAELPPERIVEEIFAAVYAFCADRPQVDDMTGVVLKVASPRLR